MLVLSRQRDETIMIGDTMETDIIGGVQLGYKTVLVLSGGTKKEDLKNYAYGPDLVVETLGAVSHQRLVDTLLAPASRSGRHTLAGAQRLASAS